MSTALPPGRRPHWVKPFLAALAEVPNVTEAARRAGISKRNVYNRRDVDPEFAAQWDDALEETLDALEGECYRRAKDGVERQVFYEGRPVGSYREYSDTLAIKILAARRRHLYGDQRKLEVTGAAGGPVRFLLEDSLKIAYGDDDGKPDPTSAPAADGG